MNREWKKLALQYAKTLDAACELHDEIEDRLTSKNHRLLRRVKELTYENQQLRKLLMNYDGSIDIKA